MKSSYLFSSINIVNSLIYSVNFSGKRKNDKTFRKKYFPNAFISTFFRRVFLVGYLVFSWMLFFSLEQSVSDQAFPPSFPFLSTLIQSFIWQTGWDLLVVDWKGIVYLRGPFPSYTQEKIPPGIFCNLRRGICSRSAVGWRSYFWA